MLKILFVTESLFRISIAARIAIAAESGITLLPGGPAISKTVADKRGVTIRQQKRPQDWSAEEQLLALHETHGLSGESLNAWCREKGLFAHHLSGWKAAFCGVTKAGSSEARDLRELRDENGQLKREIVRKDKALAEAAALLILQKKFRALWEDEVK